MTIIDWIFLVFEGYFKMNMMKLLCIVLLTGFWAQDTQAIGMGAVQHAADIAQKEEIAAKEAAEIAAKAAIQKENEDLLKSFNISLSPKNVQALDALRKAGVENPTAEHFALQKAGLGHSPSQLKAAKALVAANMLITKDNVYAAALLSKMTKSGVKLTDDHIRAVLKTKGTPKAQKALLKGMNQGWVGGSPGSRPSIARYASDATVKKGPPTLRVFKIIYDATGENLKRVGDTFKVRVSDSSQKIIGANLRPGGYVLFKSVYEEPKNSRLYKFIDVEKAP